MKKESALPFHILSVSHSCNHNTKTSSQNNYLNKKYVQGSQYQLKIGQHIKTLFQNLGFHNQKEKKQIIKHINLQF